MASDEHIAQLKKGVAAWNAWRKENPNIWPDLIGADLSGALISMNEYMDLSETEKADWKSHLTEAEKRDLTEAESRDPNPNYNYLIKVGLRRRRNLSGANL